MPAAGRFARSRRIRNQKLAFFLGYRQDGTHCLKLLKVVVAITRIEAQRPAQLAFLLRLQN